MSDKKPVASSQNPAGRGRFGRLLLFSTGYWLLTTGSFLGCANPTRPTPDQRSENATRDPMGYSPQFEKTDVSGGGWWDYDKEGMRKDLKNVLDP